jgi:hypothetical protein
MKQTFEAEEKRFTSSLNSCPEACIGNLSHAMGARNQVGIGLSYRPASLLFSLATHFQTRFLESIPRPVAGLKFPTLDGYRGGRSNAFSPESPRQWPPAGYLSKDDVSDYSSVFPSWCSTYLPYPLRMHEESAQFKNSITNRKYFLFVASSFSKLQPKMRYKRVYSDMMAVVEGSYTPPPPPLALFI